MFRKIYLDAPNVGTLEKKYLNKAIDTGYVSTVGSFVPEFEERFAQYLGVRKAVSTQSGTAALHIALHELGIGRGDEVIVPALTFIATVNPVIYVGAKPVFADVEIETWNIDPHEIERKITKKTKAIIPVHLYGNPCEMDSIMKIAKKHNLFVIEDATESLGAHYKGKYTGTFGDFGCFSFNGNKVITTGGGGMIVGKNKRKLDHIKFLVNQARDDSTNYYHSEIGFNYRMTNIEAALGLAQSKRLNALLLKKKKLFKIYQKGLEGLDHLHFQKSYNNSESSYWLVCIMFEDRIVNITKLQKELKARNIPSRRVFMPLTEFAPYKKSKQADLKNSYYIFENSLCLPSSTINHPGSISYTCKVIKKLIT